MYIVLWSYLQHHVEEHNDPGARRNRNVQQHIFPHRVVLRKTPGQTDYGAPNGEDLRRFHRTQLKINGQTVRSPSHWWIEAGDNVNDVGENDVSLDHGLKNRLDANLNQFPSRGREVIIAFCLSPLHFDGTFAGFKPKRQ